MFSDRLGQRHADSLVAGPDGACVLRRRMRRRCGFRASRPRIRDDLAHHSDLISLFLNDSPAIPGLSPRVDGVSARLASAPWLCRGGDGMPAERPRCAMCAMVLRLKTAGCDQLDRRRAGRRVVDGRLIEARAGLSWRCRPR